MSDLSEKPVPLHVLEPDGPAVQRTLLGRPLGDNVPAPVEIPIDLAGRISFSFTDAHGDFFTRNAAVLFVEQDLRPVMPQPYGAWQMVNRSMLEDPTMVKVAWKQALEVLRPWARPDANPMPTIVLFPGVQRWVRRARAAQIAVKHPRMAWDSASDKVRTEIARRLISTAYRLDPESTEGYW